MMYVLILLMINHLFLIVFYFQENIVLIFRKMIKIKECLMLILVFNMKLQKIVMIL